MQAKIYKAYYDEFFILDIPRAIKKYRKPLLVLHGERDEAIPSEKDPVKLFGHARKPKKLVIIKGADHSYRAPRHQRQAVAAALSFIKRVKRSRSAIK